MRILLDVSLPASLEEHSRPFVTLTSGRELASGASDFDLLRRAAEEDYTAVAFLGRETLGRVRLLEDALDLGIGLVVTNSDEPVQASDHFEDQIRKVAEVVGPARVVLILAHGVRDWTITEFLSEHVQARGSLDRDTPGTHRSSPGRYRRRGRSA